MASAATHEKLWTPANVVTLLRICLVPVFVVAIISPWPAYFPNWHDAELWKPWIAAGIFALLAATDGLDGYLARSRNEVTNFGKFIDPLADKILVAAALLALIELGVLPSWVALVILTREFIVSGIRMVAASQGVVIAASWYGKAKTVSQIIAILLFIIKDSVVFVDPAGALENPLYLVSWAVMLVAVALTIISMLDYFAKSKELLGFTSSSKKARNNGRTARSEVEAAGHGASEQSDRLREEADRFEEEALSCANEHAAMSVLSAAKAEGKTIGTAESLTGGLIAATLTAIPGSSEVVKGAVVSYCNEVKQSMLAVSGDDLEKTGAVTEETAIAMAVGARSALAVDVAVSATGIAGPGGAEPGKPVGTVWIGYADAALSFARCFCFDGGRDAVRECTVASALALLSEGLQAAEQD